MAVFINGVQQGATGSLSNIVEDITPQLGADLDTNAFDITGVGHVGFLAAQDASAGANDLDDYEEGTWTPQITFATPGDLTVVYSQQVGTYSKLGQVVTVTFNIVTSTFTHTTASGTSSITGLPFTIISTANYVSSNSGVFRGVTKTNYTVVNTRATANGTTLALFASGSGQAAASVQSGDMPTGGTVVFQVTLTYIV